MKKLMTVLASAATALFAFGEGSSFEQHGADFEAAGFVAGEAFLAGKADDGTSTGQNNKYWYSTSEDIGTISNYEGSASSNVPDMFDGQTNKKYLHIDTSSPLFRSALPYEGSGDNVPAVAIGDGIYLDTLVQFTAADDAFQTNLDTGDKIAISYVEHEDDVTTDENEAWTNFVIRAGKIVQGSLIQDNYFAAVPAGFNKEDWHRLTVRTINISATQVGFIIYLDGDMDKALAYPTTVDAGFGELSGVAAAYYNGNLHALYPSAVDNTDGSFNKISAASFSGTGALDDVVFTATKPSFITEQAKVTIAWTEGVATVTIGDAEAIACTGASSTVVDLPTNGTVLVTATFADGYEAGTYTVAPPGAQGSWNSTVGGFVNLADGNICTVVAKKKMFEVNGVNYDTFAGALAAAVAAGTSEAPATIKLLANVDTKLEVTEGFLVIDLAGKTITDGDNDGYAIVNSGATLTIINSTETLGHVIPSASGAAVGMSDGTTVITGGSYDGVVEPADEEYPLTITGGQFLDVEDAADPKYWALIDFVEGGTANVEYANDYFVVGGGVVPPTTYELTVTDNENATTAITINGTPAETGAEIEDNDEIVITATPKSGYEYASAPEGWTLDEGVISKTITVDGDDVEVTIPAPTAVIIGTYEVTVTPADNATYAAAYKVGGAEITPAENVLTVTVGQTIVITATAAEGYEYAEAPTGWTLSEGVITIEVSEAGTVAIPAPTAKGGDEKTYPSYIDGDAAKGKYDTWATYAGISDADFPDAQGTNKDAYLLNCKPSEVADAKAAFKFTSISYDADQSKWVTTTTTSYKERAYNGTVEVKSYSDVGCKTESATGSFFKAELK